jgi:FtsP/CotA-like multicopper oxidase with cupredoxin domain
MSRLVSRRRFLRASGTAALGMAITPPLVSGATAQRAVQLTAAAARVALVGQPYPETDVWTYNGTAPGPEIRLRQGERLHVAVRNRLAQDTTVHWHGLRVPNAMDGVPDLTQPSIEPGGSFAYDFVVPDAGTYWYHSHAHSAEQVGRGLYGPLIVEEPQPPAVDRDIVWVLGDWRLTKDAAIAGGFHNPMEVSMAGRVGNTVTINGQVPDRVGVRAGERIRLRLINAAPARFFSLEFRGHAPWVITNDGQPIEPHAPAGGRIVLGPAMRTDVILDLVGEPGSTAAVIDDFYPNMAFTLVDLAYAPDRPLRNQPLKPPQALAPNTMPEPALTTAKRHVVTFGGGMMGGMNGGMGMGGMMNGAMWTINGVAATGHRMEPALTLHQGESYILALRNETSWHHPIHLHGHSFRVIARNGEPTRFKEWRDTVHVAPHESVDIALVADNPGDWMFHCHVLDHQEGGMMAVIRVA